MLLNVLVPPLRVRATLRSALTVAVRQGQVQVNVAGLVRLPAGKRPKPLVWTEERITRWTEAVERLGKSAATGDELAKLEADAMPPSAVMVWTPAQLGASLDQAESDRLYALLHLVAHMGMRRGEAFGYRPIPRDQRRRQPAPDPTT